MHRHIGLMVLLLACPLAMSIPSCGPAAQEKAKSGDQASAKLAAMNRMADAFAKDPNNPEIFEALEDFRNAQYNPAEEKEAGAKILEVYKTKIAGKYKGQYAADIAGEMKSFEIALGK